MKLVQLINYSNLNNHGVSNLGISLKNNIMRLYMYVLSFLVCKITDTLVCFIEVIINQDFIFFLQIYIHVNVYTLLQS